MKIDSGNFMYLSLAYFRKICTASNILILLVFCMILLFTRLGFWQIQRAHEKQNILTNFAKNEHAASVVWQENFAMPNQYQKITITGRWLPQVFFLDNQYRNHSFGYDVIQPLVLVKGGVVLVDRGWIAVKSRDYDLLPKIHRSAAEFRVKGMAYYPSDKSIILGAPLEKISQDQYIIESQDINLVSKILHKSVYPFIMRELENSESGFLQQWPIISMPPARHYAYAWQWFGLALLGCIVLIVLKRKNA